MGHTSLLEWHTVNEQNMLHYLLERSQEGKEWLPLHTTPAKNKEDNVYAYTDMQPFGGANYYRLVASDIEGNQKYNKVVKVTQPNRIEPDFSIYPNPSRGYFNIGAHNLNDQIGKVIIIDALGRVVLESEVKDGMNTYDNLSISGGPYHLRIDMGGQQYVYKLVVVN